MTQRVRTFEPRCRVRLYKTVLRDKVHDTATAASRYRVPYFDLTDYLGDGGGIRVSKGVSEPAGGFTLTFPDKPVSSGSLGPSVLESIYGLVEPMDLIEIRFAHKPSDYTFGELPVVMRGWVTDVRRDEAFSPDGKPSRRVVVSGQDFGKILQILQIYYIANAVTGDNIIHGFGMLQKYGIGSDKMMPISEFLAEIGSKIVTPWIENLLVCKSYLSEEWLSIKLDVTALGEVNYQYINNFAGGSIHKLMADVCDVGSGFKELFVEDRQDGIYLVCRQTPWYSADGKPININTPERMEPVRIFDTDIVSISRSRSDANVANAFWVRSQAWNLISDQTMKLTNNYGLPENGINNSPGRYGYRLMESEIRTGAPDNSVSDRLTAEQQSVAGGRQGEWQLAHLNLLRDLHKDEVVFERGKMRVRGDESIRAGKFIEVWRGNVLSQTPWTAYVTHVDHEYMPFGGFFTTIDFERGTGFIERAKNEASPYLSEMNPEGFA